MAAGGEDGVGAAHDEPEREAAPAGADGGAPAPSSAPLSEADRRARAEESVARRFSRVMNATTSRAGFLTDPPFVALQSAVLLLAYLGVMQLGLSDAVKTASLVLLVLPTAVALAAAAALLGVRRKLVAWLAEKPFPVDNMNAVLNGLGDVLEVQFTGAPPATASLNAALDAISPDAFVVESSDVTRLVEVRIGVVDSKRNPSGSNHARFVRVQRIVDEVLAPLAGSPGIASVRVR